MDPTLSPLAIKAAFLIMALIALFVIHGRYKKKHAHPEGCRKVGSNVICGGTAGLPEGCRKVGSNVICDGAEAFTTAVGLTADAGRGGTLAVA